jgi:hypothetical protein
MVVLSVYFARSGAGTSVAVGTGVCVAVGKDATVAVGINDAVGIVVGVGVMDAHAERINVNRSRTWMDRVDLFRMGCILPLVA